MSKKPTIFVLGTDHFSNPDSGDLFMTQTEDILTEKRQKEMIEVVDCLKKFNPTKVALEVLIEKEEKLNQDYDSYRRGDISLSTNEHHQIGFRLTNECNLDQLYAVDWNEDLDSVPEIRDMKDFDETGIVNEIEKAGQNKISQTEDYYQQHTIKEYLLWMNEKENVTKDHEIYMKLALMGKDNNPIGAKWTANYWYYRNLIIYKNLVNLIDTNEERIFVLYGAGHLHLLLQFLKESNLVRVEVAKDYLQ